MLGERDYIKQSSKKNIPILKFFLLVSVLLNLSVFVSQGKLWQLFSVSWDGLLNLQVWTLVSSVFLAAHNGLIAFVFDLLIFYYSGKRLEESYGEYKLKQIFKWTSVSLLIITPILLISFPSHHFYFFSSFMLGVVCAYSWYFYEVSTRFYIFFVLPVDLKGKHILLLISLYGVLTAWSQNYYLLIQFAAVFLTMWLFCTESHKKFKIKKNKKKKTSKSKKRTEIQQGFRRHVREDLADPEIDAILDKILAKGIESLSDEEKKILESRSD